jgi:hypothetical protein
VFLQSESADNRVTEENFANGKATVSVLALPTWSKPELGFLNEWQVTNKHRVNRVDQFSSIFKDNEWLILCNLAGDGRKFYPETKSQVKLHPP